MEPVTIGILCLVGFLVLMFSGISVAFAMIITGIAGVSLILTPQVAFQLLSQDLYATFTSYTMAVIPLFSIMGFLANYSGLGGNLFNTINKWIGHRPGGLANATNVACCGFGAICGSVPATIATMASIAYPEMKRYKYHDSLATGTIAAASSLSVLIPPSVLLVIYGVATETSVGRLFAGGIGPGIVLCIMFAIAIEIAVKRNPELAPRSERATWEERFSSLAKGGVIEVFIIFIISIGGLFLGVFTPTEAGAVGAAGMLVIGILKKKVGFKELKESLMESAKLTAMIFLLIAGATVLGRMFTLSRIPQEVGNWVSSISAPPWSLMLLIALIFFIAGLFIEILSLILVTIPIFFPVVTNQLGYDPVWFCVLAVLLASMGALTPPVGMNAFMTKGILKQVSLASIFRGMVPFLICEAILLILIVFDPQIVTFIPDMIYGVAK